MKKPEIPEKIIYQKLIPLLPEDEYFSYEDLIREINRDIPISPKDLYFKCTSVWSHGLHGDECSYEIEVFRKEELSQEAFDAKLLQYKNDLAAYNDWLKEIKKRDKEQKIAALERELKNVKENW